MFKTSQLDLTQYKLDPLNTKGSQFIETAKIELSRIYQPPMINNPGRVKGLDAQNIEKCIHSFMAGIDYNLRLPAVRPLRQIIDGVIYDFEMLDGSHRLEAFHKLGYQEWLFEVYALPVNGYSYTDAIVSFQLVENNHKPRLESSIEDVVNAVSRMIADGASKLVENTQDSITQYVEEYCSNMTSNKKGKIIQGIMSKSGTHQDVVTYTPRHLKQWIELNSTYEIGGKYDNIRQKYGWSVKEGYEYEYIMNAAKKFAETGKESYFILHTKAPTAQQDLNFKRHKMDERFDELEQALVTVFEYYKENGEFPWGVEGFFPQDRKNNENPVELFQIS